MTPPSDHEVIRDPLWGDIQIDPDALAVVDCEPFQRLRYVRQLGHAFLVYPGATHTRFEHALGAYHLARRATTLLTERGDLASVPAEDVVLVRLAALLHDVGHYPFSHALEEAGLLSHEALALEHLRKPDLAEALARTGIKDLSGRLVALIRGTSASPLQGLISGSVDLDKIEYLTRDARSCGVPYGNVDVDRLLDSLALVAPAGTTRPLTVAVHERGTSALESLLFAKYQMYRNVYRHHAVRSATAMFKRMVRTAIAGGGISGAWIAHASDEALMEKLRSIPETPLADRLRRRQLYKRALDLPAAEIPEEGCDWIARDPDQVERIEDRLARQLGLQPGDLLMDYPAKPTMLDVELSVVRRGGTVGSLQLDLLRIAEALHASARRFRVFTAEPRSLDPDLVFGVVEEAAAGAS